MRLIFATSTELVRLPADAVVCVMAAGNYSDIYTAVDVAGESIELDTNNITDDREQRNTKKLTITMQLGQVEAKLNAMFSQTSGCFIRIGKSLIVNRDYITSIKRNRLVLSDCRTFKIKARASQQALKVLKELLEKEDADE